ncbi:MAG: ribosomal protein S18-alanine N-acetyltransferase [bacterium]|nr:ribosomal protein S18-alanine N-acetyltransferase [bacterium]
MEASLAFPESQGPVAVDIRPMAWGDLQEVLAIEGEVFPTPWPRSMFLHEMRYNRQATIVVAHLVDRRQYSGVVGYAGFWDVAGEMHVTTLAVDPSFQRRGIAHELMDHCMDVARALGCTTASLEVRLSNEAAQQLYDSYGFVVAGRKARYYQDGEDALIMTLERL